MTADSISTNNTKLEAGKQRSLDERSKHLMNDCFSVGSSTISSFEPPVTQLHHETGLPPFLPQNNSFSGTHYLPQPATAIIEPFGQAAGFNRKSLGFGATFPNDRHDYIDPMTAPLSNDEVTNSGLPMQALNVGSLATGAVLAPWDTWNRNIIRSANISLDSNKTITACNDNRRVYIDEIRDLDVLCGRGGRSNHHVGNKLYRQVVQDMKMNYRSINGKKGKTNLSRAIVNHVCNYGGRFVKKDNTTGRYYLLSPGEARKKTSQALREMKDSQWTL